MIKQIRKYRNFIVFNERWWWRWHEEYVVSPPLDTAAATVSVGLIVCSSSSIKWWVCRSFICFWIYYCCLHICFTLKGRMALILWSCSCRIISSDFLLVFYCLLYLFCVPYLLPLHHIFWRQSVTMWGWRTDCVICITLSKMFEQSSKS